MQLVALIYDAATDPSSWPVFLKAYAEAMDCEFAAVQTHHFNEHFSELLATFGLSLQFKSSYAEYYSRLNPWREHGRREYVSGRVLVCEELYPQRLLMQTEFYNDYLLPIGFVYSAAAVLARDSNSATTVTVLRPDGKGALGEAELKIPETLLPHMMRANEIRKKLAILETGKTVLDNAPFAVLFLNDLGKCIYANAAAEEILQKNDGLQLRAGKLGSPLADVNAALECGVREALSPVRSIDCREAVLVDRGSMRRPYQVIIAPLSPKFSSAAETPRAIVTIADPDRPVNSERILEQLYGLTAKEAEVANRLCEGKAIEDIAKQMNIGYETARTHLRRIFNKTGVSRQAELVLLLAQISQQPLKK